MAIAAWETEAHAKHLIESCIRSTATEEGVALCSYSRRALDFPGALTYSASETKTPKEAHLEHG